MHQYPVIASAILYFVGINGLNDGYWPQFYPYLNEFDSKEALGSSSYKQKQKWDHYFFGEMTVSVEEYVESITKKNKDKGTIPRCQRVTVFSVRGLLLNGLTLTTECKPNKRLEQILYIDGALWNYPHFKIKIDSSGRNAIVLKLIKEEKRTGPEQIETVSFCDMTIYDLEGQSTVAKPHKTIRVPVDGEEVQDCKSLKGESGVVPLGVRFEAGPKSYKFSSKISEYVLRVSNGNDLDIILLSAKTVIGARIIDYWLVFLAKGVIIDIMAIQGVPNFLVTKNSIVCERFAMIERYEDNEMYSVLSHWDSVFCTRTRFTLANKDGRLVKQNLFPSEIGVYDEKCKSLMTRMKSNKMYNWGMPDGATILGYTKNEFPDLQEYLS